MQIIFKYKVLASIALNFITLYFKYARINNRLFRLYTLKVEEDCDSRTTRFLGNKVQPISMFVDLAQIHTMTTVDILCTGHQYVIDRMVSGRMVSGQWCLAVWCLAGCDVAYLLLYTCGNNPCGPFQTQAHKE